MVSQKETVCVTGASGFIGSWLVMRLLERGYFVRATVRDPGNLKKVQHLLDLPNAKTLLTLWKADLSEEGSYDETDVTVFSTWQHPWILNQKILRTK
uniref:Dihydroflavonol 4-reductase n=1 Tax=Arabidopsis thaliana TaxID=3702 RepID=Q9FT84_ARATH|nr:dihydroflavonol 4-reductase [Arabidopsis thaliana]